jgi:hypothetical protein
MDKNFSNNPKPELPPPETGSIDKQPAGREINAPKPEKIEQAAPGERLIKANDAIAQATNQAIPTTPTSSPAIDDMSTQSDDVSVPAIADDVDVIEKEWVQKAKNIVENTKEDPSKQSSELSGLKKEYRKNRFGNNVDNKLLDQKV